MPYLIKAVGLDLAAVNTGLASLTVRQASFETKVLDAACVHTEQAEETKMVGDKEVRLISRPFEIYYRSAKKIVEFVARFKPDIVGLESFTNQPNSYVGFSMSCMGTLVRHMLYEQGIPMLEIGVAKHTKFVNAKKVLQYTDPTDEQIKKRDRGRARSLRKQAIVDWVEANLGVEFEGDKGEISDMSDACVYAYISALFFSGYWLKELPKFPKENQCQYDIFYATGSVRYKSGLLDQPEKFLIRNPKRELQYKASDLAELDRMLNPASDYKIVEVK